MKKFLFALALSLVSVSAFAEHNDNEFGLGHGGGWGYQQQVNVNCSSWNYAYAECRVSGEILGAYVVAQQSKSPCNGSSYGFYGNTLWVNNGCRAIFNVTYRTGGGGYPPPPPPYGGGNQTISCSSYNHAYDVCYVSGPGFIRNARLIRQASKSPCNLGSSWGWERDYIWVDHGCRGTFSVNVGW